MGVNATYNLTITGTLPEGFDAEDIIGKLRRQFPDAKRYLDKDGNETRIDGCWREIVNDVSQFSEKYPNLMFYFAVEEEYQTTTECRYYFENGKHKLIEPIMTWPEFSAVPWGSH